jgi:CubicO group peptidase (beta-lactamase class C family)
LILKAILGIHFFMLRILSNSSQFISPFLLLCLLMASAHSIAAAYSNAAEFEEIRTKHQIPALAVAHSSSTSNRVQVFGVRKNGSQTAASTRDKWQLGSNGKSMTATLVAILVEKDHLSFDSTLSEIYDEVHADLADVTVKDLLAHRAGLVGLTDPDDSKEIWKALTDSSMNVREQRTAMRKIVLSSPATDLQNAFHYSNVGYVLIGDILQKVTGQDWEELIQKELFEPLNMQSCSFGAPGEGAEVPQQPWPHVEVEDRLVAISPESPQSDNPPSLGPAGTVHCSLQDWMKFSRFHIDGFHGKHTSLLSSEGIEVLHSDNYRQSYTPGALVFNQEENGDVRLGHNGSNGMNYALFVMDMQKQEAFFAVANRAGKGVAGVKAAIEKLGAPRLCLGTYCLIGD